jgi:hypothetical protein
MINNEISPLQLTKLRKLPTGMAESSHLSQAYLTEPERIESVLAYAFGTQNQTVISMLTGGIGNTRFISNREYKWDLHGQNERSVEVSRDHAGGGATPGINESMFKLYFSERLFEVTDVLVSDNGTQVRVQQEPYPDGVDYVYTVQLIDPNQDFINPDQVDKGARFSKDYSTVEEYSNKGGGTNFSAPITLTNQLTTLRKKYAVTRSAATDVMVVELYSEDGKTTKYWTKLLEWNSLAQWYKEIDKSFIYSIYNKNSKGYTTLQGENKRPIYHGAGLRQQISPANIRYYSKLTYEILDDFLLDLSYCANRWGGEHKFVALTGKMGMREFQNAVIEKLKGLPNAVTNTTSFISGDGMERTLGGAFTTVKFLNGIELTVKEFPPYDDTTRNRTLHPVSRKPIESYRFTILNFGTTAKGKANIRKVAKMNSENAMWYVAGSTTPFGDVAKSISTMRSSGIDGYEVHMLAEVGIQLEDPTSCGELILDLNY